MNTNKIYQGNALSVLKDFPDESIDCIVTSPPYFGLRNYNLEPIIFNEDKNCEHEFELKEKKKTLWIEEEVETTIQMDCMEIK